MSSYTPLEAPASTALKAPSRKHLWYHGTVQILSVLLAATVVVLFPAFTYWQWSLPTTYSLKTTQQYVNFVVIAIALLISVLLSHCLSITNAAEVQADFEAKKLTLAGLETRSAASRKDIIDMIRLASHNRSLWGTSAPYSIAVASFSAMAWVLSLLFVIDARLVLSAHHSTVPVSLGVDIPSLPDACRTSLTAANCTYDLAASALTSQLITHTPYTFANVTFSGPVGTQALPVGAMEHFASETHESKFGSEQSEYCLPVLKPNLVTCKPVTDDSRAKYTYVTSRHDTFLGINLDTYEIVINPNDPSNQTYLETSGSNGTMIVSRSKIPADISLTILTASGQYADLLSKLTTGNPAPYTNERYNETIVTVVCEAPYNDHTYSWQNINFTLDGGVMSATPTNQICRENKGKSPLQWLDYAIEQATRLTNIGDGYSKLLNQDYLATQGPDYDRMRAFDMSPLEYILSHIVAIVFTAWTATNADIANHTEIATKTYEHRYVVTVEIKNVTILALTIASVIFICALWQAWRWAWATATIRSIHRRAPHLSPQWQLLDPVQLLTYGAAASDTISKLGLASEKKKSALLRDLHGPVLGSGPGTLLPSESEEMLSRPQHGRQSSASSLLHQEHIGREQVPREIFA